MSHVGILGIAVKSGYRRIGIATKLIETLIEEAKKQMPKNIILDVYENNFPSKDAIQKLGFKEVRKILKAIF
jgi:ribosomal protein S18 acetylase RimI-like enzyme